MAVQMKRIGGGVRQGGKLIPLSDGEALPPPPEMLPIA